jgi:hypothetical protein
MPDCSVDAVVTDPPYGLSFMGKKWDYDVPGVEVWAECLRVLKPGGHLLCFAGTRTQHRMAVRIEDAGFEIRDMIAWVYGSGFPKSLDVSKAIDKAAGAERKVVGTKKHHAGNIHNARYGQATATEYIYSDPATPEAKQWQGWGTALKPALEPITVARKPLIGTVAENVLQHGTGAINVDGCRVGRDISDASGWSQTGSKASENRSMSGSNYARDAKPDAAGRWPANFIHDGSEEVVALFPYSKSVGGDGYKNSMFAGGKKTGGHGLGDAGSAARFFYCAKASKADRDAGLDSIEIISIFAAWEKEDLQVRLLVDTATSPPRVTVESTVQHKNAPEWSTLLFGNQFMERFQMATKYTTSTEISSTIESRTLRALAHCITSGYIPGVSCVQTDGTNPAVSAATSNTLTITIDEATASALGANPAQSQMQFRISASDGRNIHSTVKPTDLMRYLCRLVTPPNGIVLDPFMGSGSTGKAAALEGFSFIGIEREAEYVEISQARINHVFND